MNELQIPAGAKSAEKSMELLRVWIADGHQEIVITPNLWDDPRAWGLLLADITKHLSHAYAEKGVVAGDVHKKIVDAYLAEIEHPTD